MNHLTVLRVAAAFCALAIPATAQEIERMQPDFTFKMVSPPSAGAALPSLVQIDPDAPRLGPVYADPEPQPTALGAPLDVPDASEGAAWFWATVPRDLDAAGPARMQKALAQINNPPASAVLATPRLQALQDIAVAHGLDILRETVGTPVSPALVLAVISVESAGQSQAVSPAGAEGLMQLMPATAERFGVTDSFDAAQNIKGGVAYLDWLLNHFDGDAVLALAGYNAGEGNVRRYDGVPPFPETRGYVPKVLAAWDVAKGLCLSPPELITDPCVFLVNGS